MGGYILADTYIEYIDRKYGWHKVLLLLMYNNYREIFQKSDKEIHDEWTNYIITAYYQ